MVNTYKANLVDEIKSIGGREIELDWKNNPRLKHWLKDRPKNTVINYRVAYRKYTEFTGMTPEELINEKWKDLTDETKKPWEKETAENRVRSFNKWLQEEYVIDVGRRAGQKGTAPRTALMWCAAIVDFFGRHNLPLNIKLSKEFKGATKGENATEKMTAEQIEKLAYHAPTKRDKAYIWIGFQSGLDVSTVLSLNWGHIEKEFDNPPMGAILLRELERRKEKGRRFTSAIYKTAIKHLKSYLVERFGKAILNPEERSNLRLEYDTPLFVGEGKWGHVRLRPRWIQDMMRQIAPDAGIAGSRLAKADINPLRPHALRASFSDQMAKAGASKQLVDYLTGHKLEFDTAYFGGEEGLREAYVEYAELKLEPKRTKPLEEIESVLREEIETLKERDKQHMELNRLLKTEIEGLRKRMERYEAFTRRFMEMSPEELEEVGKVVERKRQTKILEEHEEAHRQEEPYKE